jgi:hypothetical protein
VKEKIYSNPVYIYHTDYYKERYSFYFYEDKIYFFLDPSLVPSDLLEERDNDDEYEYKMRIIDNNPQCKVYCLPSESKMIITLNGDYEHFLLNTKPLSLMEREKS